MATRPFDPNRYKVKTLDPNKFKVREIEEDDPFEDDPRSSTGLGSFGSYLGSLITSKEFWTGANPTNQPFFSKQFWQDKAASQNAVQDELVKKVERSMAGAASWLRDTPISQMPASAGGAVARGIIQPLQIIGGALTDAQQAGSVFTGLFDSFVQTPIEAISGMQNVAGTAKAATPQEQANAIHSATSLALELLVTKKFHNKLLPAIKGEQALNVLNSTRPAGRIATHIGKDALAGAAGGAVGGFVQGIGEDDPLATVIASSIGFAPLGAAFGALGYRGRIKAMEAEAGRFLAGDVDNMIRELAALKDLRVDANSSIIDIANSMDAIATADDLVKAAVQMRMSLGQGVIVSNVTDEVLKNLADEFAPATQLVKPVYTPSDDIQGLMARDRSNYGGDRPFGVKFLDPFDHAAVRASGKGKSARKYMMDLVSSTGLSEVDIRAHGLIVRQAMKKASVEGTALKPRTQPEIDAINNEFRLAGEDKLLKLPEGGKFKDNTDVVWVKENGNISNGTHVYPINSDIAKLTAGRLKGKLDASAPYIELPSIKFDPGGVRSSYKFHVYKSATGDAILFPAFKEIDGQQIPQQLNPVAVSFFEKTGFIPGEVVVGTNGIEYRVDGKQIAGKLAATNLTNGKKTQIKPNEARRNPKGIDSEMISVETINPKALNIIAFRGTTKDRNPAAPGLAGVRFFSPSREVAEDYADVGGSVLEANLIFNNPHIAENWRHTKQLLDLPQSATMQEVVIAVRDQGYDGIHWTKQGKAGEYVDLMVPKPKENAFNAGVLNPEAFLNNLYDRFKKQFNLEGEGSESFENVFRRFIQDIGIKSKEDAYRIQTAFYSNLQKDALRLVNSPEDAAVYTKLQEQLEEFHNSTRDNLAWNVNRAAESNGMYIIAKGGGGYEIKTYDGQSLTTVSSAEEALDFVNKSKQDTSLKDLDGGNSNTIPPTAGNGGMPSIAGGISIKPSWVDKINFKAPWLAPAADFIASVDTLHGTQMFGKIYLKLQASNNAMKRFAETPKMVKVLEEFNGILDEIKRSGLTDTQLNQISDYIETMNVDEIKANLLYRPLNKIEISEATKLANSDVEAVLSYMRDVKDLVSKGENPDIARQLVAKDMKDLDAVKWGDNLLITKTKYPKDDISIYGIIRLAQALKNPETHLTRAEFLGKHQMTLVQKQLAERFDKLYKDTQYAFGIDKRARLVGYVPHIKVMEAVDYNPYATGLGENTATSKFIHELTRMGIQEHGSLIRNPIEVAYKYLQAGIRDKSGMLDALREVRKASLDEINKIPSEHRTGVAHQIESHIDAFRGIPSWDQALSRSVTKIWKEAGFLEDTINTRSVVAMIGMATQGGRIGLAARDFVGAVGISNAIFGAKFTKNAFFKNISKERHQFFVDKGYIPKTDGIDMMYPSEGTHLEHLRSRKMVKMADTAMKLSGQPAVYNKMLAGITSATYDLVSDIDKRFNAKTITKEQAFKELGLSIHHPGVVKYLDELWENSKMDSFAQTLAMMNSKILVNLFGNHNTPISWNSKLGKLLGQYGSWGANMGQTMMRMMANGSGAEKLARAARWSAYTGAIVGSGAMVGLDLKSWLITPLSPIFISPIYQTLAETSKALTGMASGNDASRNDAWNTLDRTFLPGISHSGSKGWGLDTNVGNLAIPYSFMVQDFVKAANLHYRDYGLTVLPRAIGIAVDEDDKSWLQEATGMMPRNKDGNLIQ